MQTYELWIEAEIWNPKDWNPIDDNSDVVVTFVDGTRWVASFYTYANIATLAAKNRQTGECLHGAYLWGSDMILIAELSRPQIEQVVAHLRDEGLFELVFARIEADDNLAISDNAGPTVL
jgi:hypothetical protein